jgi:tRNA pseudouridine55 synthase
MNGVILVDKEAGMTSRDVVNKVGRILNTKRVGHTGTLDPMATGVLVLCIGTATKIGELITSYDKEYVAEITLGLETDTLDIEGNVLREEDASSVKKDEIENALQTFIGKTEQEVPLYSAIRVNGKRLYDYARHHIDVELPKREIEINELILLDGIAYNNGKVTFKIKCHVSKGTYIRSLVRDIGVKLGCPATMSSLRRIRQGNFKIEDCYTIENIEHNKYELLKVNDVLPDMEQMIIDKEMEFKIRNGAFIDRTFTNDLVKIITSDGEMIAIYQTVDDDSTKAKPFKMLL